MRGQKTYHESWSRPRVRVDGLNAILHSPLRKPDLAAVVIVEDIVWLTGGASGRALGENAILGRGAGANTVADDGEPGARSRVEEVVETLTLRVSGQHVPELCRPTERLRHAEPVHLL